MTDRQVYSPVDRGSLSADGASQSFLSPEEKDYVFDGRRPAKSRFNLVLRTIFFLFVLVLHAGLIVLLARWLAPSFLGSSSNTEPHGITSTHGSHGSHMGHMGGHKDNSCASEDDNRVYAIEETGRDSVKNPNAEFTYMNPCGNSAAEARERGCKFGLLYGAWLHPQCYDEETEENFRKYTNWRFWLQPNRTQEVTIEEASKGEHDFLLVEWEFHQRHCAEMNRRLFTAVSRRGLHTIDSYLSQWEHWDHCAHAQMEVNPMHGLSALLWRKFPDCGLIRWNY
ncbi:hypothetical protein PFICI_02669 [Pestalotiopsis fici W106-1]|uniref:Uncharacterized protein n=1 Tax=Pestalotiopsis fici (strain W106-1 / CGMCC3.15140) TaxID=1229662 RepID=W3XF50_PESFW|nr:uncharacterized protein PFICI_02669 [Pestalotiopsis fici W106-1]ETS84644.1 hypothetical protein PFICI_02669 [Pestalotiopsis fici W106-1]